MDFSLTELAAVVEAAFLDPAHREYLLREKFNDPGRVTEALAAADELSRSGGITLGDGHVLVRDFG